MKRTLLAMLLVGLVAAGLVAQTTPYDVVFDLTSRDSLDQKAIVRWIKGITDANPTARLEVVMYGKGFELVMPERSTVLTEVAQVSQQPNVSFAVCAMALKNNKVEPGQLLDGVKVVPDGIYEIITRQRDGWGYIKVGH